MAVFRNFENELGNQIKVAILRSSDGKRVGIVMEGPSSRSTNLITRREAEELSAALCEALEQGMKR